MTRKPDWYKFATTRDLIEGLSDPSTEGSERNDVAIFVHGRILRPFLGLNLLVHEPALWCWAAMGATRSSIWASPWETRRCSTGRSFSCQYLGKFSAFSRLPMSAWAPLFVFGTIATCGGDRSGPDE